MNDNVITLIKRLIKEETKETMTEKYKVQCILYDTSHERKNTKQKGEENDVKTNYDKTGRNYL